MNTHKLAISKKTISELSNKATQKVVTNWTMRNDLVTNWTMNNDVVTNWTIL
jgi:hypothetical protein